MEGCPLFDRKRYTGRLTIPAGGGNDRGVGGGRGGGIGRQRGPVSVSGAGSNPPSKRGSSTRRNRGGRTVTELYSIANALRNRR